ncbi:hypothetical protein [Streptomyces spectabilis]|uniref:Uncharacterized protein n=1 Tax=Streptomyces spectabilis TaxID=68270 RepID=A0A516R919_STRST|nr:hypothetical protein [Streptomyces spectabilis]QDQ12148.1 hypothetical protein FH965_17505 [Streptomyces spectabilis]
MSAPSGPTSVAVRRLWCECSVAEAKDPALAREWLLGTYAASSPRLAVRWFCAWAPRLADLIEPPHDAPWVREPSGTLRPARQTPLDAATALRAWPQDVGEHDQALTALRDGAPYRFTVSSDTGVRYCLSARPVVIHSHGRPGDLMLPPPAAADSPLPPPKGTASRGRGAGPRAP